MRPARSGIMVILALLLTSCRASQPGKFETYLINGAKHDLTVRNKGQKNPLPTSPENIVAGREAFSHYCMVCHGLDGQNTGVPFATRTSPPVPSLKSADVQRYTDGQLKWIIDNGISPSGMPASKGILNNDEMWSIVIYIRNLPPAGSLGEPCVYSGENCGGEDK